jgi:hypothetical protein
LQRRGGVGEVHVGGDARGEGVRGEELDEVVEVLVVDSVPAAQVVHRDAVCFKQVDDGLFLDHATRGK